MTRVEVKVKQEVSQTTSAPEIGIYNLQATSLKPKINQGQVG